jgi:hypothetical protein
MTLFQIELAARNNAIWSDTICREHGIPGEFDDAVWINRHPVPRFYSNVVTLADQRHAATQLARIQGLLASSLPGRWSVKDSFRALDLTALGFELLFEATWLWRGVFPTAPPRPHTATRWTWVSSSPELANWETAWAGDAANASPVPRPRLFVPALLTNPDVAFIAGYQDQAIVAGAIANRTDDIVGVSNVFVPSNESIEFWSGCIASVQERFPGLPLVGYEREQDLTAAQAVGFERVQNLRVWTRQV